MKILLFIYACSWALLLLVLAYSLIFEKQKFKEAFDESPWIYVAIFLLAPIVIFLIPYIVISSNIENRKIRIYVMWDDSETSQTMTNSDDTISTTVENSPLLNVNISFTQITEIPEDTPNYS